MMDQKEKPSYSAGPENLTSSADTGIDCFDINAFNITTFIITTFNNTSNIQQPRLLIQVMFLLHWISAVPGYILRLSAGGDQRADNLRIHKSSLDHLNTYQSMGHADLDPFSGVRLSRDDLQLLHHRELQFYFM
jgi:hypothetical protein